MWHLILFNTEDAKENIDWSGRWNQIQNILSYFIFIYGEDCSVFMPEFCVELYTKTVFDYERKHKLARRCMLLVTPGKEKPWTKL